MRIDKAQAGNRVNREGIVMPSRFGVPDVAGRLAPARVAARSIDTLRPSMFHTGYECERSGEAEVPGGMAGFRLRHILRSCAWL